MQHVDSLRLSKQQEDQNVRTPFVWLLDHSAGQKQFI